MGFELLIDSQAQRLTSLLVCACIVKFPVIRFIGEFCLSDPAGYNSHTVKCIHMVKQRPVKLRCTRILANHPNYDYYVNVTL